MPMGLLGKSHTHLDRIQSCKDGEQQIPFRKDRFDIKQIIKEDSLVRKEGLFSEFNTVLGQIRERAQSTHGNLSLIVI